MSRRGLTLLEILVAVVLLATLTATCVPVLRIALAALHPPDRQFELLDLAQVAGSFMADPSAFGIEAVPRASEGRISWPNQPDRPAITVRLVTIDDPDAEHGWVVFSSGGWTVQRWVQLDTDTQEAIR
jgi:prepilin-type N-terminal cleavage/methylation domain-containing protein